MSLKQKRLYIPAPEAHDIPNKLLLRPRTAFHPGH